MSERFNWNSAEEEKGAPKSDEYINVENQIASISPTEEDAHEKLRGVWVMYVKNVKDYNERSILEGLYDKSAAEVWRHRINVAHEGGFGTQVFERLADELRSFNFANVETQTELLGYLEQMKR